MVWWFWDEHFVDDSIMLQYKKHVHVCSRRHQETLGDREALESSILKKIFWEKN